MGDFGSPPVTTVEFHIDFGGTYFPYATYDLGWTSTCQEDCPPNQQVKCSGTLDRADLTANAQRYGDELVRLNAFRSDYPGQITCQPEVDPTQGLWFYQLVVTGGPNKESEVNSACPGRIYTGRNVVKHTELASNESHNQCAPELGGAPPS